MKKRTHQRIQRIPRIPGSRPRTAARDLPSSRAGGQDDVSSQANSLKLSSPINKSGLASLRFARAI
ncbi:MAG: hypothetical protein VXW26_16255, partial [SAR324 cluster bacterium]|nr:hypothetical protein [SAR324 cluster bacterium]